MLVLTHEEVEQMLTMSECIQAIEASLKMYARGEALVASNRISHLFGEGNASSFVVVGALTPYNRMVLKALQVNYDNPAKYKLPHMHGIILLSEQSTGAPLALMAATHITNVRTGALAGIGAKYLAKEGSEIVAVLGSREIAREAVLAVVETVPSVGMVRVYSSSASNRELFAKELGQRIKIPIIPADNVDSAIRNADIVITATSSREPALFASQIRDGMFIAALGSNKEIELGALGRVKVVAETAKECRIHGKFGEALRGNTMQEQDLFAELAQIVIGEHVGRISDDEVFLLDSIGLAIEDASIANLVYGKALRNKIGTEIEIDRGLRSW